MKATGIVRRIDDLGRVVIPKEIRRTMRIREGDPLEIFTDNDGEVVFKKYSPVGEMSPFAAQYADVMSRACGLTVLICDRDHVVAAAGGAKKDFLERRISGQLEEVMDQRQTHVAKAGDARRLQPGGIGGSVRGGGGPHRGGGRRDRRGMHDAARERRHPGRERREALPGGGGVPRQADGGINAKAGRCLVSRLLF